MKKEQVIKAIIKQFIGESYTASERLYALEQIVATLDSYGIDIDDMSNNDKKSFEVIFLPDSKPKTINAERWETWVNAVKRDIDLAFTHDIIIEEAPVKEIKVEERMNGGMTREEYRAQREYAESFPPLNLDNIDRPEIDEEIDFNELQQA